MLLRSRESAIQREKPLRHASKCGSAQQRAFHLGSLEPHANIFSHTPFRTPASTVTAIRKRLPASTIMTIRVPPKALALRQKRDIRQLTLDAYICLSFTHSNPTSTSTPTSTLSPQDCAMNQAVGPQPDFPAMAAATFTLADGLALLGNVPAINQGTQILDALQQIQGQLNVLQQTVGQMQGQLATINNRLDGIDTRLDGIDNHLCDMGAQLNDSRNKGSTG